MKIKKKALALAVTVISLLVIQLNMSLIGIYAAESEDLVFLDAKKPPVFELIGREEGLSNLSISSIIQDKYGFLWLGTQGGLNRYDGHEFQVFRNDPFNENGLVNNQIQTMYYDEIENEIWIGTYQGISSYNIARNEFKNYRVADGLSNSVIIAIDQDINGDIWAGTMDGLNKIDKETGNITTYSVPADTIRDIYIDNYQTMYIGTLDGLYVFNSMSDSVEKVALDLPSPIVMSIQEFSKGELTLGLWDGGIAIVDVRTKEVNMLEVEDNRVYCVLKTSDNTLWVGTWGGGLYAYKYGEVYKFTGKDDADNLSHPVVYSLFQDETNMLWIGTNGGGLNFVNPRKEDFVLYKNERDNPDSLSSGKINTIFKDSKDRFWISVYNQGINVIEKGREKITKIFNDVDNDNTIPTDSIRVIKEFDSKILLGTDKGIGYFDYGTKTYTPWNLFQEDMIYDIEIINDSQLWIGTRQNGVYFYDTISGEVLNYQIDEEGNTGLSDNHVFDVLNDSKGRVWVGTNNGLNLMRPGADHFDMFFKDLSKENQLASNVINVLYEDGQGKVWIGLGDGGIAYYDEVLDGFVSYTENDGLLDNTVESIVGNDSKKIWIGTHSGISIFDTFTNSFESLQPHDGIGGYEFSKGSYADDYFMYFGGAHGVIAIPKSYSSKKGNVPKTYITDVKVYDDSLTKSYEVYNGSSYVVSANENFFEFSFIAIDFDIMKHLTYYYKLSGYDEDYKIARSNNSVDYSHLPPGDYTFRVFAKTPSQEETNEAFVTITIKAPWYNTTIAYLLFALSGLLFVFLLIRLRESFVVKKKNVELASVNHQLHDANETLKGLSLTDGLTGVYNHRYFENHLNEQLELAKRNKNTYISVLMIDIDNYKGINDQHGHIIGDHLLQEISRVITLSLPRNTDFVARYGGDEFVVVLYDTKIHGALIVAQRIRRNIENCFVLHKMPYSAEEIQIGTTASLGVVSMLVDLHTSADSILQKADEALYKAKEEGKNKVIIHQNSSIDEKQT